MNELEDDIQAIVLKLSKDFPNRTYIGKDYSVKMLKDDLNSIIEKFCNKSDKFVEVA